MQTNQRKVKYANLFDIPNQEIPDELIDTTSLSKKFGKPLFSLDELHGVSLPKNVDKTEVESEDKTRVKPEPNWSQTEAKLESNQSQIEAELKPNKSQTRAKLEPNRSQTRVKLESKLESELGPNWSQTGAVSFYYASELQKKVLMFLQSMILSNGETRQLRIENITFSCSTTVSSAKKALQRLESIGVIIRTKFKAGKGGWTQYKLIDSIISEILDFKLKPNWSQTGAKLEPILETISSNIIKTITTETELDIDLSPLEHIKFNMSHVKQILGRGQCSQAELQDSIYAYAFDLQKPEKANAIKDKIGFFISIMSKGLYTPAEDYESPQTKCLKLRAERLRKDIDEAFEAWYFITSEEEISKMLGVVKVDKSLDRIRALAKDYFIKNVWGKVK